jgi:hypothetical protein
MRVLATLSMVLAASTAYGAPPVIEHAILGYWTFPVPGRSCSESSYFGPGGLLRVTSGAEVTESEYEISAAPSSAGFYEYRDRVTKSNGLKDCTGDSTVVGAEAHWYVKFSPDGNSFLMCRNETLESCFGPIRRPGAVSS